MGGRARVSEAPSPINLGYRVFVPLSVDAQREVDGVEMVRATYFVVTADAPSSVWEIELPPLASLHGLGALGMLGVVFSTLRQTEETGRELVEFDLFQDPEDVATIFALEDDGPLSIKLEDVWLPVQWCFGAREWGKGDDSEYEESVDRGDVYRVEVELFQQAYRYGSGDITIDQLISEDPDGRVFRSPRETFAFQLWANDQIEKSRQVFEDEPSNLQLRWE